MNETLREIFSLVLTLIGLALMTVSLSGCEAVSSEAEEETTPTPAEGSRPAVRTGADKEPVPALASFTPDQTRALFDEFEERVAEYLKLRKKVSSGVKEPDGKAMPEEIAAYRKQLIARLMHARAGATQGQIFFPRIQPWFRSAIDGQIQTREEQAAQEEAVEEPGAKAVAPEVNKPYPEDVGRSTLLPALLRVFPVLPEQLEYRFAGRSLALLDRDTQLILDYIPQAY